MYKSLAILVVIASPLAANAQPAPGTERPERTITRAQYIQRAADMAGRRFDAIDTTHSGVVTRDQIRAWRQANPGAAPGH